MHPLNPAVASTFRPPVMEARRWLEGVSFPAYRPLINVSQAAPLDPPPEGLRRAIAEAALDVPEAHLYGPVLGNGDLRDAVAKRWNAAYGGALVPANVAITQGCNQAFCAAIATVAGHGDEVIIPVPWYFNHKMWLDMQGIKAVPLVCGEGMIPDAADAERLVTARTRAIVLVTPNNPSGAEYPAETLRAFFDLARNSRLALVVDETYRDFDSRDGAPHDLFTDPDWGEVLIQLYSFSKAYRLTGHRVGALVASERRMIEVEKVLDTLAISTSQLGQIGGLWGMTHLDDWLAGERREVIARRDAMRAGMSALPGWKLKGCGAYFAWAEHPFADIPSPELAKRLVREAGVLLLPGTMFMPEGDSSGQRHVRIAFANISGAKIDELMQRLAAFRP